LAAARRIAEHAAERKNYEIRFTLHEIRVFLEISASKANRKNADSACTVASCGSEEKKPIPTLQSAEHTTTTAWC